MTCRLAAIGCFLATVLTALASWADVLANRDTSESLQAAAQIQAGLRVPNASVLERLAERRRWDLGDRDLSLLRETVRINPRLTSARIRLGLAQESARDFAAAERTLLALERYDRQHLSAWTLANYYFRRDQRERFWTWASRAAERTYDDFRPLLRLVDTIESSPSAALEHLHAGAKQQALGHSYLNYLIADGRLDDAEVVALRLPSDSQNRPRIADLVDRSIRAGRTYSALQLWNKIGGELDPIHDKIVTNGDFQTEPSGIGFDWKLSLCKGTTSRWSRGSMEFEFAGTQSDTCVLLEQTTPAAPGRRYYAIIDSTPPVLTAQHDASLRILLERAPGTLPFQGSIVIRSIRMQAR